MTTQKRLSLPPNITAHFAELEGRMPPDWFCTCDPAGSKLGSGGGTVFCLHFAPCLVCSFSRQRHNDVIFPGKMTARFT